MEPKMNKADYIMQKKKEKLARMAALAALPPEAPPTTNNYFTCKATVSKPTNAPKQMGERDADKINSTVNGKPAGPKVTKIVKVENTEVFIPTIDLGASKGPKKKK
jgi:hypothetical protein